MRTTRKKSISIFLILILIIGSLPAMVFADNPAEEPVWVTMTADKSQVAPGEEITLTMSIDQTVENAYIWQWNIIWNKDLFDQVEMKKGDAYVRSIANINATSPLPEPYYCSSVTMGNQLMLHTLNAGTLCTLTLRAKSDLTEDAIAKFYIDFVSLATGYEDEDFNIVFDNYTNVGNDYEWGDKYNVIPPETADHLPILISSSPAEEPAYNVTMPEDQSVIADETILITIPVGHNADETTYNAFDMSFSYDKSILELTSTEIEGLTIRQSEDPEDPNIGIVRVMGYGFDRDVGTAPFVLTFVAKTTGVSEVILTSSKVVSSGDAISGDAPEATVADDSTEITVSGYPVTLPEGFSGNSTADPGEDYTFSEPVDYYDYTVSATVGGEEVEITDNGDGSYTIPAASVTGSIVITATKAGQVFDVTLGEDMSGEATAQYMSDYVATLTKAEGFTYEVAVTVGGEAYTGYAVSEDVYTIPGEDITGDIVFTVTKTEIPAPEFTVTFEGDGAGAAEGAPTAIAGEDYMFWVTQGGDYSSPQYEITATVGGESVDLIGPGYQNYFWFYRIKGEDVTGDIVITVTKIPDLDVEVNSYVELDGKTVFLVTATGTLEEGKAYAYDGNAMFYSEVYEAWCYLTIEEGEFNAEIAKANIVATETSYITLTETCDVNMSGLVDINDAQLVYDIYNGKYQDFTSVEMQKFLNADTNGDKTVNVTDAAAVVAAIQ
mgnify:FL=1